MLSSLFASHGSDKDRNGYSSLYNVVFLPLKDAPVSLLEVGIGTMIPGAHSSMKGYMPDDYRPGASLRAWKDFFQNGQIHGMDVQADCISPRTFATPRIPPASWPGPMSTPT